MIKRLEITVPTNAPDDCDEDGLVYPGCWVDEVVKTLGGEDRNGHAEEFRRFQAQDGIEYTLIKKAFSAVDTQEKGVINEQQFGKLVRTLAEGRVGTEEEALAAVAGLARAASRGVLPDGSLGTSKSPKQRPEQTKPEGTAPDATPAKQKQQEGDVEGGPMKAGAATEATGVSLHMLGRLADRTSVLASAVHVQDMWKQIDPDETGEVSFDTFRAWWPHDDTTQFQVTVRACDHHL